MDASFEAFGSSDRLDSLEPGAAVAVYFNIRRRVFSVMARSGEHAGRVVAHARALKISDASFVVHRAGRDKVLKTRVKSVHAFIVGRLCDEGASGSEGVLVSYNPYKHASFVTHEGAPILRSSLVIMELGEGGRPICRATIA